MSQAVSIHEISRIAEFEKARTVVLRHGWNSTSYQIVNPGIEHWFAESGDAVVGFVRAAGVRVVAGAPVCSLDRLPGVTKEFELDAVNAGERVCYFGAEARLEAVIGESEKHSKVLLGAQPIWRPEVWESVITTHKSLRAQINRARNKGVVVREWPEEKARDHPELVDCLAEWLRSKGLPPLHFVVESDTLGRLENRRIFVAEWRATVAGFVVLSPVSTRNGWLFEQFPHRPGAPNGTVELMIDAAMRAMARDNYEYATLGLSPLSTRAEIEPFDNPVWLRIFLAWMRKHGRRFYNFDGLDAFKAKLHPEAWEPVFAISNEPRFSSGTLYAIASAFSGNAPSRMAIIALWRAAVDEWSRLGTAIRRLIPR